MDSEQKDFKAVKVQMKQSQKTGETLSRSMLYSGINIFGQLSQLYLQNKVSGGSYSAFTQQVKPQSSLDGGDSGGSMMHLSQEVLAIFKKLQKKDSTTKIKAFVELDRYIETIDVSQFSQEDQDSDELQNLLTFFLYHFCRIIMNEPDKKVREAAHQSFSMFIKKAKKRIGPHLKKIFSLWYCSFFDVSQEVATIARKNFETAFPENKRDQVFKIAYKNFLHFANEQLKQSEESITESAADLSKAQREDVFDRITSSVFFSLAGSFQFIKNWPQEDQEHFKKKLLDILDLNVTIANNEQPQQIQQSKDKKQQQPKKQQSQSYLWGFLQTTYRGRVRSSCLQFISNLMLNLPVEIVQHHISQLSPLVYNLLGEDNSSLQNTLWREALFTLAKNFPESWETVNIKKNILPKLYNTLKNAGYGAPLALYENFIKFASIFPFYHLVDYVEDKQNKASFKERCNLIREAFTTLYQGLRNDEAVAFHSDLLKSYYETLTFVLWKRVQPLLQKDSVSQEDKQFALDQIKKCIQVSIEDYINNFDKFQSRVQNQRNIRYTIPNYLARMFRDLADRKVDERIYETITDHLWETVQLNPDKYNTIRLIGGFIKSSQDKDQQYYDKYVLKNILLRFVDLLTAKVSEDVQNLSKDNIDGLLKKLQNLTRAVYKLNRGGFNLNEQKVQTQIVVDLLQQVIKKEELAKNVLQGDVIAKFQQIKELLVKVIILTMNLQKEDGMNQFVKDSLNVYNINLLVRNKILTPQNDFKKVDFKFYYDQIKESSHSVIMEYLQTKVIDDQSLISQNYLLLDQGITSLLQNKPTFLSDEDLPVISQQIMSKLRSVEQDVVILAHYFNSIKTLIVQASDDKQYDQLKHTLFDKLLILKSKHQSYSTLWNLFEQVLRNHINKKDSDFFDYCKNTLKQNLKNIIHNNSNFDIDTFNRFTQIVKAFVQLCQDKQQIIEEILLQEDNFNNLENNSLPLKMFRDLFLSGGVAFDVTKLFTKDNRYVWLASALVNSRHLSSLANYIQLKKQLLIFVDTEVIPALINQAQTGNSGFVLDMIKYMGEQAKTNNDYVYTLEYFVKKMIDPGEDFPAEEKPILKVDEFKQIFQLVNQSISQQFLHDQELGYSLEVQTFLKLLKNLAYFIIDENIAQELYQKSKQAISLFLQIKKKEYTVSFSIALEIFECLFEYLSNEQDIQTSQDVLLFILQNSDSIPDDSHQLNAILQYTAYLMTKLGVAKFYQVVNQKIDFQSFISKMIEIQSTKHLQPLTYIYLFSIIRKTIGGDLIKDKQLLIDQVIEIAKDHALTFEIKIQKIQENLAQEADITTQAEEQKLNESQDSDADDQIENFEYEMLQDLAETLLVFPSYINASVKENDLYILISSGIESLQKAAFVLLKYLYENYIPQIKFFFDDSDVMRQLKIEQDEADKEQAQQENEEEKKEIEAHVQQKYKNKLAFKNISEILIEIIESPPSISSHDHDQKQIVSGSTHIESIIFGETKEGCMNNKVFGYFLAWNALLIKIENGRIKSQLQQIQDYSTVLGALNEYLDENYEIYQMLLVSLIAYLPDYKRGLNEAFNINQFEPEYVDLTEQRQNVLFSVYTLINFMKSFPSLARKYYQECEKQLLDIVMPYIKQVVSPAILDNEIKKIEVAQSQLGQGELTFALFKSTKEILAGYSKGEIELTLKIKIPADYPLKLVEVDVSKQIKISEKQMRKWILSIRKILQVQNGDIISAVLSWKNNIEKEIEGIEDCYICYCVVHEGDQSLPKMPCKTCKNKFHVACIRKWFRTSHKSNCPICQNYFF